MSEVNNFIIFRNIMSRNKPDRYFTFKNRMEDFIVEEILVKEPSGKWDYIYIFIEKKNLTTMDVVTNLMKEFRISRKRIGIAGLKDKRGITRQWFSFFKKDVEEKWGERALIDFFEYDMRVLDVTYDEIGLRLGINKWNRFFLTLRNNKRVKFDDLKKVTFAFLDKIQKNGMPNYFGAQKMWVTGQNPKLGYLLISGKIKKLKYEKDSPLEKKFKIQAYVSDIFNKYIEARSIKMGLNAPMKWDVVTLKFTGKNALLENVEDYDSKNMIITGPLAWYDLMLPESDSLYLEKKVLNKGKLDINNLENFQEFGLFGIRRPIVTPLKNMKYMFNKNDDLLLDFDLSAGSYASVLVDLLEDVLWDRFHKTKEQKEKQKEEKKERKIDYTKKDWKSKKRRVQMDAERKNKGKRHFKKKKNQ